MKNRHALPITFVAISSLVFILGAYVLITKTTFHPQLFISACGEVLKDIQEHVHFNPDGILSFVILSIASMSVGLALFRLVKFIIAQRRLDTFQTEKTVPNNLKEIMSKHNVPDRSVSVVKNTRLTAFTIGLCKPKIVVSKTLIAKLSQEQLEAVVLHELYHLRSRHLLWLLLAKLMSSLFFFIPLVAYVAQQLRTEFELAADAFVVEKQRTSDHLRDSLALHLQYAGGVIPHFATSPIEKRINYLAGDTSSFERIGITSVAVSIFSLMVMVGTAFVQPNQVVANFAFESGGTCRVEEGCQTTDCTGIDTTNSHNFTPLVPTSFSLLSSH